MQTWSNDNEDIRQDSGPETNATGAQEASSQSDLEADSGQAHRETTEDTASSDGGEKADLKDQEDTKDQKKPQESKGFKFFDKRFWARGEDVDDEEVSSDKPTYVEQLERRLAEAEAKLAEYIRAYKQKTEVEWAKVRQRLEREASRDVERELKRILSDLLEVVDNLDLTLASAQTGAPMESLVQGVAMVRNMFLAKLRTYGLEPIEAEGKPFDPQEHEAVAMVDVSDPDLGGKVVDVLRPGYRFKGTLLRPAAVRVGRFSP